MDLGSGQLGGLAPQAMDWVAGYGDILRQLAYKAWCVAPRCHAGRSACPVDGPGSHKDSSGDHRIPGMKLSISSSQKAPDTSIVTYCDIFVSASLSPESKDDLQENPDSLDKLSGRLVLNFSHLPCLP